MSNERRVFFESIHFEKGLASEVRPIDPGTITIKLMTRPSDPREVSIEETIEALRREFLDEEDT